MQYYIDYINNKFYVDIQTDEFVDREDYISYTDYLKNNNLYFNYDEKKFNLSNNKVDYIIEVFIKDDKEYSLSLSAINQIENIVKNYSDNDFKIFRNLKYDDEYFTKNILQESVELFEFQKEDINWNLKRTSYLDANAPGLGKSLINIATFSYLYHIGNIDSVFIVVPVGLSYHWKYEILEKVKVFKEDDFFIINNDNKKKPFEEIKNEKIIIVPDYLLADVVTSYKKTKSKSRSKKLERWNVDKYFDLNKLWNKQSIFLCIDECHSIKNTKAIKTKCIHALRPYFKYKAGLTATPNINRFEDIYSQISFIKKDIIPMTFDAFQLWISKNIDTFRGVKITEYNQERVKIILDKMKIAFRKRLKEDVDEMKFKRYENDYFLELSDLQKQIYRIVAEEEIKHLQEEYDQITWKLFFDNYHLITEVFENPLLLKKRYYDNEILNSLLDKYKIEDDPKFIFLKSKIESIVDERNDKLIVYDYRPETLDLLYEKFKKYNPLIIHGKLKIKDKEKDRKEKEYLFNNEDKYKIMFLSSHTSSQGINLNKKCNTILYYNVPTDTVEFSQGIDRTHRINSTRDSQIIIPYYYKSLERVKIVRTKNRVNFNDKMGKELTEQELVLLLNGKF